ncbi:MAG: sigma 54-interacting transcriptional regulator [Dehalobacterium sp.]
MTKVGDAAHKSFLVSSFSDPLNDLLRKLKEKNCTYVLATAGEQVEKIIHISCLLQQVAGKETLFSWENVTALKEFAICQESDPIEDLLALEDSIKLVVVINQERKPVGIIDNIWGIKKLLQSTLNTVPGDPLSLMEYRNIVEQFEEEIFVTDGEGIILYLNPEAEKVCQVKLADVIGKYASSLAKAGVFSSSTTLEVLQTRKKVNMLQKLKSGKIVFATGLPIFDHKGHLHRIISTSKDVREINHLITEIEQKNKEIRHKNQELNLLREGIFAQDNFVCSSPEMMAIKDTIIKIAPTDITVMIQGESGVGKEVVAKLIHNLSMRNRYPLIKINCGLIPENLMESELFGYESGAFTGANKHGKVGKIELAHQGTLFLDEIGEMPLSLQVKLLEFLQDREIIRVGGTQKIKIDTRVIVATNRDLQSMVNQGTFRSDLFYRLNVLPINIPPLRERQKDIPLLVEYFLDTFNDKYKMNKRLDPEVEKALFEYDWPGNVRELIHFIERIIVTSDTEVIMPEILPEILLSRSSPHQKIICTELMPLKKAKSELEAQLITRAYEIYKSTYKVGKVLEIDQSTVVKLLKKHKQ